MTIKLHKIHDPHPGNIRTADTVELSRGCLSSDAFAFPELYKNIQTIVVRGRSYSRKEIGAMTPNEEVNGNVQSSNEPMARPPNPAMPGYTDDTPF